jgi:hypothetical protein
LDSAPTRIVGMQLKATMTVLQLGRGELLVHSPLPLTAERRAAVESLGTVAHLYAPNLHHHLWLGDWAAALPHARVHAPPALAQKRPDLRIDRAHGAPLDATLAELVEEHPIQGCRLQESALFHAPSRTLVLADLVHNVGRPEHAWTQFYTKAMGFYDRVALSRVIRWTAFSDRTAARRSLCLLYTSPSPRD